MESKDVFTRLENIIYNRIDALDKDEVNEDGEVVPENNSDKNNFKEVIYLIAQLFLNILKSPFRVIAKYLQDEIISSLKRDVKIYTLMMGIMAVLFVFFSVIWLSVSVAIGVYFYEQGHTMFVSILYSISIQVASFIFLGLIVYISSKRLKSLKLMKKIADRK